MSIDGPRSICQVLGHLGGGVVPAIGGQVLRSQQVLFNGPGGMCVFLCAKKKKKKTGGQLQRQCGFSCTELHFHFWFLH